MRHFVIAVLLSLSAATVAQTAAVWAETRAQGDIVAAPLLLADVKKDELPLVDAAECRMRGGLPNIMAKLKAGGEVRVGYIGGSITAASGWRPKTTQWLTEQYPNAKIVEIDAAIGGTGSDLGVFRFGQDIMRHRPHLIFVEFAVNDGGAAPEQIYRCMEGMVRQAWKQDPTIDICFVYTLVEGMVPTLAGGKFPRSASAMEKIADHYGIPSIHMGLEVVKLATSGKMVMKANPRTPEEKAALKDKIIFSGDGVHPHVETGHQFYLEAVARSFEKLKTVGEAGAHQVATPFVADHYEQAKMVPMSAARLSAGWQKLESSHTLARRFAKYMPELYCATEPGTSLTFRFKGTHVGFFDLLGPDCGQVEISVDGGKPFKVARFDPYCTYHRMGSTVAAKGLADGVHTVTVTLDATPLDKAAILAKRNEKIDNPKRFEGKSWYTSRIMLIGEPLPAE